MRPRTGTFRADDLRKASATRFRCPGCLTLVTVDLPVMRSPICEVCGEMTAVVRT